MMGGKRAEGQEQRRSRRSKGNGGSSNSSTSSISGSGSTRAAAAVSLQLAFRRHSGKQSTTRCRAKQKTSTQQQVGAENEEAEPLPEAPYKQGHLPVQEQNPQVEEPVTVNKRRQRKVAATGIGATGQAKLNGKKRSIAARSASSRRMPTVA
jgi:hypothetical protein